MLFILSPLLLTKTSIIDLRAIQMAAAVSTRGTMQFHLLVIGIAICLSCFVTTVVHSQEEYYRRCKTYPLDDVEDDIVTEHNRLRSKVYPYASNMQRMVCIL